LRVTGKLGEVMQESAQAAETYVKSRASAFGISSVLLSKKDIHVHVPEGAIAKDGPSAGVAMVVAIVSALTNIPVRNDIAMTGEITLRGRILGVGGLREKILAANRGGIKTAMFPENNLPEVEVLISDLKQETNIIPIRTLDDALAHALVDGKKLIH
jgi:ATP-dependent Lon protease